MPKLIVKKHSKTIATFDNKERVRFGRDPIWADVVLDEDLSNYGVGREHCELTVSAGCYAIQHDNEKPVWIDGKLAFDDDILPKQCVISFTKDGINASYELETILSGGAKTSITSQSAKPPTILSVVKDKIRTTTIVFSLLILTTIIIWFLFIHEPSLTEKTINDYKKSVFSVQIERNGKVSHAGTAWLAADNFIVTNRHVGELIETALNEKQRRYSTSSYIRLNPNVAQNTLGEGSLLAIKEVIRHPAEKAFKAFLLTQSVRESSLNTVSLDIYDIAILVLEQTLPEIKPLPLATTKHVDQLSTGAEITILGFPLNEDNTTWDPYKPIAEVSNGQFDKLRGFLSESEPNKPLLSYDNKTAGGNSGSPVIDNTGKVVGIHFAGAKVLVQNVEVAGQTKPVRLESGGGKSYGQHVRMVSQLIDGNIFQEARIEQESALWTSWLDQTPPTEEVIASRLGEVNQDFEYHCKLSLRYNWQNTKKVSSKTRRQTYQIPLAGEGKYFVFVQSYSPKGEKIDISAPYGDEPFSYFGERHYSYYNFTVNNNRDRNFSLTIGSQAQIKDYSINVYTWTATACDTQSYLALTD